MNPPSVTVLIPNLNGGRYLRESILSALLQDYKCKVLVVDNGSTDESLNILKEFKSKYSNFDYLIEIRKGIVCSLNTGLRKIDTDFTARLDADDVMQSNRISKQIEFFSNNPALVLLGSAIETIDESGNTLSIKQYPAKNIQIRNAIQFKNPFAHPSVMFKTHLVKKIGFYNNFFEGAEDLDLWLRLIDQGEVANLNEPLTKYRIHDKQITIQNNYYMTELKVRISWLKRIFRTKNEFSYLIISLRLLDLILMSKNFKLHRKVVKRNYV